MKTIVLSRHFDINTYRIAGICHKCYRDNDECKITAVNVKFLRKAPTRSFLLPKSPHNLIEESLQDNPWGILVATIFLNKTSCYQARPAIEKFLNNFPDPWSLLERKPDDLGEYFDSLGLKKRAFQVWRMTYEYLHKDWSNPKELYGIGTYGDEAYKIFYLRDFSFVPDDRFLRIYRSWLVKKKAEGIG